MVAALAHAITGAPASEVGTIASCMLRMTAVRMLACVVPTRRALRVTPPKRCGTCSAGRSYRIVPSPPAGLPPPFTQLTSASKALMVSALLMLQWP